MIYMYIYIYIERERGYFKVIGLHCIYIYIYIYIYIHTLIQLYIIHRSSSVISVPMEVSAADLTSASISSGTSVRGHKLKHISLNLN